MAPIAAAGAGAAGAGTSLGSLFTTVSMRGMPSFLGNAVKTETATGKLYGNFQTLGDKTAGAEKKQEAFNAVFNEGKAIISKFTGFVIGAAIAVGTLTLLIFRATSVGKFIESMLWGFIDVFNPLNLILGLFSGHLQILAGDLREALKPAIQGVVDAMQDEAAPVFAAIQGALKAIGDALADVDWGALVKAAADIVIALAPMIPMFVELALKFAPLLILALDLTLRFIELVGPTNLFILAMAILLPILALIALPLFILIGLLGGFLLVMDGINFIVKSVNDGLATLWRMITDLLGPGSGFAGLMISIIGFFTHPFDPMGGILGMISALQGAIAGVIDPLKEFVGLVGTDTEADTPAKKTRKLHEAIGGGGG